ncbi:MAG: EamA family transporter [Magnetovibrio sp.]|nr:EamA family transporter [Magnetovibrio sp.]
MKYTSGVALVLLAGAFWSTMGLAIRYIETANVWQILFYRSIALSVFLLLLVCFTGRKSFLIVLYNTGLGGVVGGFGLVMAFAGGIFAIQNTTVANAMFLFAAAPFFAAFLGSVLLGELVRKGTWVGMGLAIAGIFVMVWGGIEAGHLYGNLSGIVSALGFAIFTVALRWNRQEDMLPTVFFGGIFSAIISGIVCLFYQYSVNILLNDILIALSMGVFQVGAGLALYTIGSRVIPAAELALLSMTEVLLGPLWVWVVLGEKGGIFTLVGGGILLTGVVSNAVSGIRRKPVPTV